MRWKFALALGLSMGIALPARTATACEFSDIRPTGALPTMPSPQEFSFVATNDCAPVTFYAQGATIVHTPTPGTPVGSHRRRYTVQLTENEWRSVLRSGSPTFEWSIANRDMGLGFNSDLDADRDGWTRVSGDVGRCDHLPNRNPAAEDTCDNGIDDDCDGVIDNCGLADPDSTIVTSSRGAALGLAGSVAVGDTDGDGIADLQIGSVSGLGLRQGAVFVAHGPLGRGTTDVQDVPTIIGSRPRFIGRSVATADHDVDGMDDVFTTAGGGDRGLLFLGPFRKDRRTQLADATIEATWPDSGTDQVALTGDLDGDDAPDALLGAPYAGDSYAGRVYVASGPLSGTVSLETDATYTFTANSFDQLGVSTTRVGDLTGDGIEEIAVGNNASFTGLKSVYFFEGGIAPGTYDAASSAWAILTSETKVSDIGAGALVADDYDGDGSLDLLVGDNDARSSGGDNSGVVYALLGPFSGGAILAGGADVRWEAAEDWINLGTAVAVGDIDGDDALDVIMGAPSDAGPGWAYVQQGFTTGTIDVATLRAFTGPEVLDNFGSSIATIPDWTGDGVPEVAIGATRVNDYAGAIYVFQSEDLF
jgi:hypothetical protein